MFKKIISKVLQLITPENVGKSVDTFNKMVQDFGKSMDSVTKELSSEVSSSKEHRERESLKNQKNIEKIFGKKSDVKIWSDKKIKF